MESEAPIKRIRFSVDTKMELDLPIISSIELSGRPIKRSRTQSRDLNTGHPLALTLGGTVEQEETDENKEVEPPRLQRVLFCPFCFSRPIKMDIGYKCNKGHKFFLML